MKREELLNKARKFDKELYVTLANCGLPEIVDYETANDTLVAYLDDRCNNGYWSRWTHYGDDIYQMFRILAKRVF